MLIMRRGAVMASGDDIDEIADYAKKHKTKVSRVEICSTLGGYCNLVVRWADGAIGQFWTRDRATLAAWAKEQPRWPRLQEYSVQVAPVLLDMEAPVPEPEEEEEEEEEEEPEETVRVRRRRKA